MNEQWFIHSFSGLKAWATLDLKKIKMKEKKIRNILLASLLLLGGCKSMDCGCPMSNNTDSGQPQEMEVESLNSSESHHHYHQKTCID